ncbi:unnamed protein product [Agarophyton chilense]
MGARDQIGTIRVVNVTRNGTDAGFGSLGARLKKLSRHGFVAIDTEFSGLGSDPALKHENMQMRYAALRKLAHSCGILSIGISLFDVVNSDVDMLAPSDHPQSQSNNTKERSPTPYSVSTYDFLMCCKTPFSMISDSGEFLVAHGFDFNRLFSAGIPYDRASAETPEETSEKKSLPWKWGKLPRGLLWRIGHCNVPVIVHNGLFDLVFLFASFQGALPETLNGFISAFRECLPVGFWDTKVIASSSKERSSFLAYLFAKSVLSESITVENSIGLPADENADPPDICRYPATDVLCALYSFRGFCPRGIGCPFLHDPYKILEEERDGAFPKDGKEAYKRHKVQSKALKKQKAELKGEISKMNKKQRKRLAESINHNEVQASENSSEKTVSGLPQETIEDSNLQSQKNDDSKKVEGQAHTAGWDAFCTGYIFAAYRESLDEKTLEKDMNRVAVPYKQTPLLLAESQFANLDSVTEIQEASVKHDLPENG